MTEELIEYLVSHRVLNLKTGDVVDSSTFVQKFLELQKEDHKKGFQLVYPEVLARYLKCADSAPVDVLMYLLDNKNHKNVVAVTYSMIIEDTGVSNSTVAKVMTSLQKQGLMKKLRNGVYMLDPNIMIRGGNSRWAATDAWRKEVSREL